MSALLKLIATAAIATAIASPSNAGTWAKIDRPCGAHCAAPQSTVSRLPAWAVVGAVRFRQQPETVSRTTTVFTYGFY